jgi:hypothetical protein
MKKIIIFGLIFFGAVGLAALILSGQFLNFFGVKKPPAFSSFIDKNSLKFVEFFRGTKPLGNAGLEIGFRPIAARRQSSLGPLRAAKAASDLQLLLFNAYIDLNRDRRFSSEEWLVQNMPASISESMELPNTYYFSLGSAADFPDRVAVALNLTESAIEPEEIAVSDWLKTEAIYEKWDIGPILTENSRRLTLGFLPEAKAQDKSSKEKAEIKTAAKKAAYKNQSGSYTAYEYKGLPDIQQAKNECAPTSAANSLIWLSRMYGFEIPDAQYIISELKKTMKWKQQGVEPENFEPGKRAFIEALKLPLEVHAVKPDFGELLKEIQKGQDVEILIDLVGITDNKLKARHAVTLAGAAYFANEKGEQTFQSLTFHDPATKSSKDVYQLKGNQILGYPLGGWKAIIASAVAESPKPKEEPKIPPVAPPASPPAEPPKAPEKPVTPPAKGLPIAPLPPAPKETPKETPPVPPEELPSCAALTLPLQDLPLGYDGRPYSAALRAEGGSGQLTWSLGFGSTLPDGLSLSPDGIISGTPDTGGADITQTFYIRVSDSCPRGSQTAQNKFVIVIEASY